MNLFLVTSPFQLICAIEAKHYFNLDNCILALTEQPHKKGQDQIDLLLNKDDWLSILHLPGKNKAFTIPSFIKKLKKEYNNVEFEHIAHAEYDSWRSNIIIENIQHKKIILFDDGTATINIYNKHLNANNYNIKPKLIKNIILRAQSITPPKQLINNNKMLIFSVFNFTNNNVKFTNNTFETLKQRLSTNSLYCPDSPSGFLGQGEITFDGSSGMLYSSYLEVLERFYAHTNKNIIYFPHRSESPQVRSQLEKLPYLTYHDSEFPIEIELAHKNLKLSSVGGLSSTALYTISLIYNKTPIYSINQDNSTYYKNNKDITNAYKEIEEFYSKNNITFI